MPDERTTGMPMSAPRGDRAGRWRRLVALTTAGRVYGWGANDFGQIGDGSDKRRIRPVVTTKLGGVKVTALREGGTFTVALTSTGRVLAWGHNSVGQLGDGTTTDSRAPVRVKIPAGVTVTAISA